MNGSSACSLGTFQKAKEYLDKKEKGEKQPYDANMEGNYPGAARRDPL